jgi:hypothetical protein
MKLNSTNPVESTYTKEVAYTFMGFCSFVSILHNKKVNIPNIFIMILQDPKLRGFFKDLLDIDTDYQCVQLFLFFEPTLYKSKYIMKYINSKKRTLIT